MLIPKTMSQKVMKAGFPDLVPSKRTRSVSMRKTIQPVKYGEYGFRSAMSGGRGRRKKCPKMSAMAQMKAPSFKSLPQQQVLIRHQVPHILFCCLVEIPSGQLCLNLESPLCFGSRSFLENSFCRPFSTGFLLSILTSRSWLLIINLCLLFLTQLV